MRARLDRAIDAFADEMVSLLLAEAKRTDLSARAPGRAGATRRPRWIVVDFDETSLPGNTNASPFADAYPTAVCGAAPSDLPFLIALATLGLVVSPGKRRAPTTPPS